MNARICRLEAISRRDVLLALAAAGGGGLLRPGDAFAQGPWAAAPRSKVDKLNFVVWTYGDIYARIAKQFETDWGVKVESTISSFNDHPTKLATMFAGGEKIDVSQSSPFSFANFVQQGMVEPLDGLPGAADYMKDYSGFTKEVAVIKTDAGEMVVEFWNDVAPATVENRTNTGVDLPAAANSLALL